MDLCRDRCELQLGGKAEGLAPAAAWDRETVLGNLDEKFCEVGATLGSDDGDDEFNEKPRREVRGPTPENSSLTSRP